MKQTFYLGEVISNNKVSSLKISYQVRKQYIHSISFISTKLINKHDDIFYQTSIGNCSLNNSEQWKSAKHDQGRLKLPVAYKRK